MDNLFDGPRSSAHDIVTYTMGFTATWTPLAGGPMQTARVLLNKPTQKSEISDMEYDAVLPKLEYLAGYFPGLADSVESNKSEVVIISGVSYYCYKVERKYDGDTIIIHLQTAP